MSWLSTITVIGLATIASVSVTGVRAEAITTPESLAPPPGHHIQFTALAAGVQRYVCGARAGDPGWFAWTFQAPEATLWNPAGEALGKHFAGPAWEGADGSLVTGEVLRRADAALPDAIPWLLLKAKTTSGDGRFGSVTYIQRLETSGGVAPDDGCSVANAGATLAVPYTATYAFFVDDLD